MKKTNLLLTVVCAASMTAYALPTYEPFTEYAGQLAASPTNLVVTTSSGIYINTGNAAISNCLNLAKGGYTAPGGELWGSLDFTGTAPTNNHGLDIAVVTNNTVFQQSALSGILPATFPGYPASGSIGVVLENSAQPLIGGIVSTSTVGNSAVLKFAQPITRPTSGSKTLYFSYLLNVAQQGQLGTGNEGRYLALLTSTNLAEGTGSGGAYATWASMFNTFNTTPSVRYASHGLLSLAAGSTFYVGGCDSTAGRNWTTTPLTGSYNTPLFVVGEYVLNSGANKDTNIVWVNPATSTFGGTTPPTSPIHAWTMTFTMSDLGGLCFIDRVGSGASGGVGTNYVANLIIGDTWGYVTGGPEFTNQPVANASVDLGGILTLSAGATAAGQSVNYQWVKITGGTTNIISNGPGGAGGAATVSGATSSTLTLTGVSGGDIGTFQVVATASGTGYSLNSAMTTVLLTDPKFTASPTNTSTIYGQTATFTATVTTANAPLSYRWYFGSTPLSNGLQPDGSTASNASGITGAGTNFTLTLTLSNVTYQEIGSYKLYATNNLNLQNSSAAATLAVQDPYIVTPPASPVVVLGGTASFTVAAAGSATLTYQWYEGTNALTEGGTTATGSGHVTGVQTTTLSISGVSGADNGSYSCKVSSTASGQSTNSLAATLVVQEPLTITRAPRSLVERAGDHVGFVVGVAGSGPTFQWSFNGTPIPGATNQGLSVANIQPTNAGTYSVMVSNLLSAPQSASGTLTVVDSPVLALAATNLIVARVGDGAQALSGAAGNTIYFDQFRTDGTYLNSSQVPDEGTGLPYGTGSNASTNMPAGSPAMLVQGAGADAAYEAMLTLSSLNQQYLCFAGYCQAYPFAGSDVTTATTSWRGLGTFNAFGIYWLAYTNSGLYSGGNHLIRGMTTLDGTNFWTTGAAGSGTVKFVNSTATSYAGGSGVPSSTGVSAGGAHSIQLVTGPLPGLSTTTNLVVADATVSGVSTNGLYVASGIPEPTANGNVSFTPLLYTGSGMPGDFAFSPDNQTIYVADSRNFFSTSDFTSGGIQRWDANGSGYSYSYTMAPIPGQTNGTQGLTVDFSAASTWGAGVTGAKLYATTFGASTNSLVAIVDNGAGSTGTVLATAGPNQALRGVRFGPAAIPVALAASPLSTTNFPGNSVAFSVSAVGSGPLYYQWQFNGTNIAGATGSTLTLTNLQNANAGNYTVIVSNLCPSAVTSQVAVLTVTFGRPQIAAAMPSYVESAGDHVGFAANAAGTQPLSYQWYFNNFNTPITGATNTGLVVANIQATNSGTYYVVITNIYGAATNAGVLTVTAGLQALSSNNLVVARLGDSVQVLTNFTGDTLYLDQYTTAGAYVDSVMVPDEGTGQAYGTGSSNSAALPSGSLALLFAGGGDDSASAALMTLSPDQLTLNLAGYCLAYPFSGPDVTVGSSGFWRGLAGVNGFGFYSLQYTNSGLDSGGNHSVRSMVTPDGTNFWVAGQASANGLKYVNSTVASYAGGSGVPTIASSATGSRMVQIINGNLVFSDVGAATPGLYTCSGTPTPAANKNDTSPTLLLTNANPVDFAFSPDSQTIYISDNRAFADTGTQAGGIQRWDADPVNGGYKFAYTLRPAPTTAGARGLTVYFPPGITTWGAGVLGATLYATTSETAGNQLIKVTDSGAASVAQVLVTASPTELLSGVRFGPAQTPATITADPQNQILPAGSTALFQVATSVRSGPYTYRWYRGATALIDGPTGSGSAILGSFTASLTISNMSPADCALDYHVVVSNPLNSATSQSAALDIPIVITLQPTDALVAPGGTAVFTAAATGNGTLHYQWYFNSSPLSDGNGISGSTAPTLHINNAQAANVGAYYLAVNDDIIAVANSQTAYLTVGNVGSGTGLLGQYWSNQTETPGVPSVFTGTPTVTRTDPTVNFDWSTGSPDPAISSDHFAVIWSGQVQPFYSDSYTFYARVDDGVRVWVDGQLLIDSWANHGAAEYSGSISLTANQKYNLVMEYFENTGSALAQLSWSSSLQSKGIIPQTQLYPVCGPTFTVQPTNAITTQEHGTLVLSGGAVVGTASVVYQWFSNGSPLPGQTAATLVVPNVDMSYNNANLVLTVQNAYGSATNAGTLVTVETGAPVLNGDIVILSDNPVAPAELMVGMTASLSVEVHGAQPVYQWKFNGAALTDNGRIVGARSNVLTIVQAFQSDAGSYQLFMTNAYGNNQSGSAALTVSRIGLADGTAWISQGTNFTPYFNNNMVVLTDGQIQEAASTFLNFRQYVGAFRASWTYQETPGATGNADGTAFVMQNSASGPAIHGGTGGALGFSGINNSAAIELNIFTNHVIGIGYATNGQTGAYFSTAPVNLASGNPIGFAVNYSGGILGLTLTDTVASATFSTNLAVNIPAALGTNTGFVGFTGGTGGQAAQQQVSDFFFTSLPNLSAQTAGHSLLLSWPEVSAPGFVLQRSSGLTPTAWATVNTPVVLTNGQYQVPVSPLTTGQFYRLMLP